MPSPPLKYHSSTPVSKYLTCEMLQIASCSQHMWRFLSKVSVMEQRDFMLLLAQPSFFLNERFIPSPIFVCFCWSHYFLVPVTRCVLLCILIHFLNNCALM